MGFGEFFVEGGDSFVGLAELELDLGDFDEQGLVRGRGRLEVSLPGLELVEKGRFLGGEVGDGRLGGRQAALEGLELFGVRGLRKETNDE